MALACAAALAALALGASCLGSRTKIKSPRDGSAATLMPIDIIVFHRAEADAATLAVVLNGTDITSLLVRDPPSGERVRAHIEAYWDAAVLQTGLNQLTLEIEDSPGVWTRRESYFTLDGDPYADSVPVGGYVQGTNGGFGALANVLGPPSGGGLFQGGLDVLSLGIAGHIDLAFDDNVLVDGPGVDFTVFENSFLGIDPGPVSGPPFSEPGRVSVSQDGVTWVAFPGCVLDPAQAPYYPGCAGVRPVLSDAEVPHPSLPTSTPVEDLVGIDLLGPPITVEGAGGDSFDLADVGLAWARYVRIEAAGYVDGPFGADNAAFDLDAVAAVHSAVATDADGNGIPDAVE